MHSVPVNTQATSVPAHAGRAWVAFKNIQREFTTPFINIQTAVNAAVHLVFVPFIAQVTNSSKDTLLTPIFVPLIAKKMLILACREEANKRRKTT